jgi:hypothetical protein
MNSDQYEELCRRFVADKDGLSPDAVKSVKIPNPKRPGLPEYQHQIDLYWEIRSDIASYLNIANAKWRGSAKVDQSDVMLLQQVRQKVAAHKAFMITNVGFTDGALAAAKDEGIALHVVTPTFNVSELPTGDRAAIQARLQILEAGGPGAVYSHRVEHRGLGFAGDGPQATPMPGYSTGSRPAGYETRVVAPPARTTSPPESNRSLGGGESRGGPGSNRGGGSGGDFPKK